MNTSRARTSRVFTISFPEELAKQVVAVAEEESRNINSSAEHLASLARLLNEKAAWFK